MFRNHREPTIKYPKGYEFEQDLFEKYAKKGLLNAKVEIIGSEDDNVFHFVLVPSFSYNFSDFINKASEQGSILNQEFAKRYNYYIQKILDMLYQEDVISSKITLEYSRFFKDHISPNILTIRTYCSIKFIHHKHIIKPNQLKKMIGTNKTINKELVLKDFLNFIERGQSKDMRFINHNKEQEVINIINEKGMPELLVQKASMVDTEVRTKVFFDSEFTGLHKDATLISLGLVSQFGDTFYAEFTDYNKKDVNMWIQENVVDKLKFKDSESKTIVNMSVMGTCKFEIKSTKEEIKNTLVQWLDMVYKRNNCNKIEFWSDCLAWDWVLFVDLFGSSFDLPSCVYPYPMDIVTMFRERGIDPDVSREKFVGDNTDSKHNALFDAEIIKKCYQKMMEGK